jgi:hypothetical protein
MRKTRLTPLKRRYRYPGCVLIESGLYRVVVRL